MVTVTFRWMTHSVTLNTQVGTSRVFYLALFNSNSVAGSAALVEVCALLSALPYLTLPFGAGVLPPSAEASSGPNVHPRSNAEVTETFYRFLQT